MKTTIKHVTAAMTAIEGGKSQVKMGDARELVGVISDMMVKDPSVIALFIQNGVRRAKRVKK